MALIVYDHCPHCKVLRRYLARTNWRGALVELYCEVCGHTIKIDQQRKTKGEKHM